MEIPEILAAFKSPTRQYQRVAIDAAIDQKEEITPHLIEILTQVYANPKVYEISHDIGHIYALMLLGYFKIHEAHQLIIDLFSLPESILEPLFGEIHTQELPAILSRTCNGSMEAIKTLILNQDASVYSRIAGTTAICRGVFEGIVTREEALEFLGSLLTGEEAPIESGFYDLIACNLCGLCPAEIMDTIKQAYAKGLIDPTWIELEEFEQNLAMGQEAAMASLQEELDYGGTVEDIHAMSDWFWFETERRSKPKLAPIRPKTTPNFQLASSYANENKKSKKKKQFWDL
jgi:hypothetical protein